MASLLGLWALVHRRKVESRPWPLPASTAGGSASGAEWPRTTSECRACRLRGTVEAVWTSRRRYCPAPSVARLPRYRRSLFLRDRAGPDRPPAWTIGCLSARESPPKSAEPTRSPGCCNCAGREARALARPKRPWGELSDAFAGNVTTPGTGADAAMHHAKRSAWRASARDEYVCRPIGR